MAGENIGELGVSDVDGRVTESFIFHDQLAVNKEFYSVFLRPLSSNMVPFIDRQFMDNIFFELFFKTVFQQQSYFFVLGQIAQLKDYSTLFVVSAADIVYIVRGFQQNIVFGVPLFRVEITLHRAVGGRIEQLLFIGKLFALGVNRLTSGDKTETAFAVESKRTVAVFS